MDIYNNMYSKCPDNDKNELSNGTNNDNMLGAWLTASVEIWRWTFGFIFRFINSN